MEYNYSWLMLKFFVYIEIVDWILDIILDIIMHLLVPSHIFCNDHL